MRAASSILLLAVVVAPACGSGSTGDGVPRGMAGAAGTGTEASGSAIYRVPVTAELEPWARYPVDEVEFERDGGRVTISYPFPEWLSGDSEDIDLEGDYEEGAASFDVTAEQGSGTCTRTGTRYECTEHLPGLEVDPERARESMEDAGLDREEIARRLLVTGVFETDPIGILEFEVGR
ncbi:MAG TPA: hypothetical protein VGK73_18940 [Polyangiaceae bacterium]